MLTKFIEATQSHEHGPNWGKFLVLKFMADDWEYHSALSPSDLLLRAVGTHPDALWVLDLQTGEGASFVPGGHPTADLNKHKVWVCPMFEPFLKWLYEHTNADTNPLHDLPALVELPDAEPALYGYRRPGNTENTTTSEQS